MSGRSVFGCSPHLPTVSLIPSRGRGKQTEVSSTGETNDQRQSTTRDCLQFEKQRKECLQLERWRTFYRKRNRRPSSFFFIIIISAAGVAKNRPQLEKPKTVRMEKARVPRAVHSVEETMRTVYRWRNQSAFADGETKLCLQLHE